MASRKVTKRKSPCQDKIFFGVNANDLSPEHSSNEDEPEIKLKKTDMAFLSEEALECFNLETDEIIMEENTFKAEDKLKDVVLSCEEPKNVVSCEINPKIESTNHANEITDKTSDTQSNDQTDKTFETPSHNLEIDELNETISSNKQMSDLEINEPSDSEIHLCFGNKTLADLYKFKFIKFLNSFIELEIVKETDLSVTFQRDSLLNPSDWIILDETPCSSQSVDTYEIPSATVGSPTKSKKKKAKKKKKEDDLFILDTNPSHNESNSHIAKYSSKFQIEMEEKVDGDETPKKAISVQTCFNCNENHSLKDCPLPKIPARINAARNKFKAQKQTTRYHLEEDQKYSHFLPGHTSEGLRSALGLRKNELPPYIYRMRVLGYPPGWLEEAKFVHSNLDMFDAEGNTVRQKSVKKQGLNPEKIIEYPGFNISTEKHIKDDYKYYDVPPYSEQFNKQAMINYFDKQFACQQDDFETCEMDLDLPENGVKEKQIGNPQVKLIKETTEPSAPSPSLVELEKQKENLLLALEDNTSSNLVSEENTSEEPEKVVVSVDVANDTIELKSFDDSVDLDNSTDEGISDSEKSFANSAIKTSDFGTPILKSQSPYSRLPHMDNFTKDVSPVINFENLPNATGKYEQMTEVLAKVRNKMKHLQNCNT